MAGSDSTCWTVIRGAAEGCAEDRETFARHYLPAVRAYFGARWRGKPIVAEVEDATQEVFVECFRGVLERADENRPGGFRALLYGVARNVGHRFEERRRKQRPVRDAGSGEVEAIPAQDDGCSHVFDRAWAQSIMDQARLRQAERARAAGPEAERRCELLRLRFEEGLPIRQIARLWAVEPARLHHEYARARLEFKAALLDVIRAHQTGSEADAEAECAHLLALFS